jgi:hypothetical protein
MYPVQSSTDYKIDSSIHKKWHENFVNDKETVIQLRDGYDNKIQK